MIETKEIFLIRKIVNIKKHDVSDTDFALFELLDDVHLELEVIKEIKGFILGEKLNVSLDYFTFKYINCWNIRGTHFPPDAFLSMIDYRDRKLKELL